MPGMNGFELYQKIRTIDTKVKVCFLTALSELKGDEPIPGSIDPNCNKGNFIQKPIENENLLNKINDLLKS
jgi:two-component SAPR family response regulator